MDQPPKPAPESRTPSAEDIAQARRETAASPAPIGRRPEGDAVREHAGQELAKESPGVCEDQYRLLFDRSPLPAYIFDAETLCVLAVNDAAVREHGGARADLLARSFRDIRPADEVARLRQYLTAPREKARGARVSGITETKTGRSATHSSPGSGFNSTAGRRPWP